MTKKQEPQDRPTQLKSKLESLFKDVGDTSKPYGNTYPFNCAQQGDEAVSLILEAAGQLYPDASEKTLVWITEPHEDEGGNLHCAVSVLV